MTIKTSAWVHASYSFLLSFSLVPSPSLAGSCAATEEFHLALRLSVARSLSNPTQTKGSERIGQPESGSDKIGSRFFWGQHAPAQRGHWKTDAKDGSGASYLHFNWSPKV